MPSNRIDEIKFTIERIFSVWSLLPNVEKYQLECSTVPKLNNDFHQMVESVFLEEFRDGEIISNLFHDSTGHASFISVYDEACEISCYLLICHFYPVATLRIAPEWMIIEGVFSQWDFAPKDKERLDLIRQHVDMSNVALMNTKMSRIENDIREVLSLFNYSYLPWNSLEFSQEIKYCLRKNKAWDYIFYLGVPTG
jgi:hypothetical protein